MRSGTDVFADALSKVSRTAGVSEHQRFINEHFDAIISQYDDDKIGALSEIADSGDVSDETEAYPKGDEEKIGSITLDSTVLDSVLDEFLDEQSLQIHGNVITRNGSNSSNSNNRDAKGGASSLPPLMGSLSTSIENGKLYDGKNTDEEVPLAQVITQLQAARLAEDVDDNQSEPLHEDIDAAIDADVAS